MPKKLAHRLYLLLLGLLLTAAVTPPGVDSSASITAEPPLATPAPPRPDARLNLALGNPSGATASTRRPNNFLMEKEQYALSYNRQLKIPNWVSWHVDRDDLGDEDRGQFAPDTSLPPGWPQVRPTDYRFSVFRRDRGHMCPSGDRTATREDNDATFLMTNMIPQAPDNNQGPWAKLEIYCRERVRAGNEMYIIAGGDGSLGQITPANIRIPARTWKVIVELPEGDDDLSRIDENTRVIAVDMPNSQGIRNRPWREFLTTTDAIERATGYDFLSNVPRNVQRVLESRVDSGRGERNEGGRPRAPRRRGRRRPR